MTAPSSAPRGERPGRPGTAWETSLVWGPEVVVPDEQEAERPNRATRRAARAAGRRKHIR